MVCLNSFLLWGVLQGHNRCRYHRRQFAYLKALEKRFNDEMGEVELPAMDTIKSLFKENYLNLDTIKKLKP